LAAALRAELAGLEARLQLCAAEAEQHRAAARALEQQLEAAAARAAALQAQVDAEAAGARDARTALQRLEAQVPHWRLHASNERTRR